MLERELRIERCDGGYLVSGYAPPDERFYRKVVITVSELHSELEAWAAQFAGPPPSPAP